MVDMFKLTIAKYFHHSVWAVCWLLVLYIALATKTAGAVDLDRSDPNRLGEGMWGICVGRHTDTRFVDIVQGRTDFQDSYLVAIMYSLQVGDWPPYAEWDAEVGITRHWGLQRHKEINAAILLRFIPFPYAQRWRATAGLGIGPSWASRTPNIERDRGGRTSRRLLFMPFELTFGTTDRSAELFTRVHHRSGGFDVFSRGRGSNFVTIGARHAW